MEGNTYASYQGMMAQVDTALAGMESICRDLEMEDSGKKLAECRRKLESHKFSVGIMGEFKRGKSTVINSLLEKEIMPADILPCSATMNRVTYDMHPHAELRMQNGSVRKIGVDELVDYVTKLTSENESRAASVEEAIVYYPCRFCQNGVDIVDTPGLNDDERMNKISEEVIPKLDAVIMVVVPGSPFSMSEAEFVRTKLMSSDLGRLIFLVNKIDTVRRPQDRQRAVDSIREKIQTAVMEKMADMYGENSKQYQDAKMKVGNIRIYPFSALDALEGKQAGDRDMIESSGTIPFEAALTKLLTEERGALELGAPISAIQKTAIEVAKNVESRRSAMELSSQEFEKKQKAAIERIQELRRQKKDAQRQMEERARSVQSELAAGTARFYPELEQRMMAIVDDYSPDPKPFATAQGQKEGAEKLQGMITSGMNAAVSNFSEKIIVNLQDIIDQEALNAAAFADTVSRQVDNLRVDLAGADKGSGATNLVATGVDVLTDFVGIYGIGGVVAGYQAAGVKGALAGGGVGLVANLAVAGILGSLSIVGLPMVVISCAVGTFVSKKFAGAIFAKDIGEKKLREIKAEMRKNVMTAIREMQIDRNLENWVDQLVGNRFDELSAAMGEECETMLSNTENTLNEIRKSLTMNEAERKNEENRLKEAEGDCIRITKELQPVCEKVQMALQEIA